MKTLFIKFATIAAILAAFTTIAAAWDCPSGQIRQQAPAGTPTTAPYYDVVEGIAFICVPTPPSTPPAPSQAGQNQNQQQNQNQSQSSNSNSSAAATSTSAATSKSASTASGGSATATGGSSALKNSGNSKLTNSGNSSNTNTNSATGGQGGTASSASSNNSSGNTSTYDSNSTSNYTEVRQNPGATAPVAAFTTSPCSKGYSGGASTPSVAATFGIVTTDKGCDSRQTAAVFYAIGNSQAAARILCSTDASKRAKLTLDECLAIVAPVAVVAPAPVVAPIPAPQIIVVPVAAAQPAPAPVVPVVTTRAVVTKLGTCGFDHLNCMNRYLDQAILALQSDSNAVIVISGPLNDVPFALKYLRGRKVDLNRVVQHISEINTVTIAVEVNQ